MGETVKWNDIKRKIWLQQKMARFKAGCKAAGKWVLEHPMEALALGGGAATLIKKGSNMYCAHAEDVRRRRDFYDTRTGRHSVLTRDLRRSEQVEVDRRFTAGETYVHIFDDMGIKTK